MASPQGSAAVAEQGAPTALGLYSARPARARLAIVVFLSLMGLMAARYAGLEHDPRRAAAAQRSISQTFTVATGDTRLVAPLDREEGAAAALRRTGTTSHDPAQLEAGEMLGEVRIVLAEQTLFEPATGRLRNEARPRIGRLVARVLGTDASRVEIMLNDRDLGDPATAEKIARLITSMQGMGLPRTRVAFGSGAVAPSTWLLEAVRNDPP